MSEYSFPFATRPLVIAHRGACGVLPEQTLESFDLAIQQGANAMEFDVVPTRDGKLLVRHESELSLTTDVADRPEFASRRRARASGETADWFADEFTSAELRTLRARQRFPFRDHSYDDQFALVTLDQVLDWRSRQERPVPLFIEIKHPAHFARLGFDMADLLLETLASRAVTGIFIKSFESHILRDLHASSDLPLVQLLESGPIALAEIARYATGISVWKRLIVPTVGDEIDGASAAALRLSGPTTLVRDAHVAGLFVAAWTFRDEAQFLAADFAGNPAKEYAQFFDLGVDAVISDFPATAIAARGGKIGRSD
ncbi:MAG TPA: glycerophosphodiester phosphodiesterase family protein [Tepidisphaeraceae bacterium]|nr:glycerophosphodiester phosphodiesterase family protein [Tepidisphaeraceae bacterium]